MRYHTNFFLLSVAFCKMGNVRGGLIYSCLGIDTDPSAFLCGDIQFYYLDLNINDIYIPYRTLLCLFTLRIVTRVRARHFILTRISERRHLQQSRQYKTTAITNIQNNNGLPIHAHRNCSFAGESQRCCTYFPFPFQKTKNIMIGINHTHNSSHTLSNYLVHLPLPLSSLLISHPTHSSTHQF